MEESESSMLLMLLDKFIKQSEVFDIIYEDDCRDVISTITDLSNINAVSATLCASAERTGHTLAVLSVLRRLLLFPCLGTVSVSSTGKGGVGKPVDVGIQALCAVEESARLIFDVAKKADGNRSGNRSGSCRRCRPGLHIHARRATTLRDRSRIRPILLLGRMSTAWNHEQA